MITSLDTNVVLDIYLTRSPFHSQSLERVRDAHDAGQLVACHVVYAEIVPQFPNQNVLESFLSNLGIMVSPISSAISWEAGRRFQRYREAGGARQRILPDFLIGAHALVEADALLTRDRGFFATYFPELRAFSTP